MVDGVSPRALPALSARADTMTVQELLEEITRGRLNTPSFQRGLRWREEDQTKLLDSVLQGIPIGTLLLSDPFIDQPELQPTGRLILDGQQRMATLRALVTPAPQGVRALHLDTTDRSFRFARVEALDERSTLIPVSLLGDPASLLDALMAPPVSRETLTAALAVSQRLREYRVPIYELHDATEDLARTVFDRINATGRRLRQAEVFNALHARGGDAPVQSTAQVVSELQRLGFGTLAEDEITKTVAVLTGHDPGRDVRHLRLQDPGAAMIRAQTAITRAITFLRDDADIPHREALPYALPLIVLARLFDRHPEVTARSRILLRRWVWRGAASGAHQGARASLRAAIQAVGADEHASVQSLLAQVPRDASAFGFSPEDPVRKRHAVDRVLLCTLAARRPVDLRSGRALDVATLAGAWSVTSPFSHSEVRPCWAGVILHPRARRSQLVLSILSAEPAWLVSHVITPEARASLERGEALEFIASRGAELRERVRRFLNARAEWIALDTPAFERFADPS